MGRTESIVKQSFRRELLVCFILTAMLPVVISCVFMIRVFKAKLSRDYEKAAAEQMENVEKILTEFQKKADMTLENIASNPVVIRGITETDSWIKSKAYKQLYEQTRGLREQAQFLVYDGEGKCVFTTSSSGQMRNLPPYWGILKVARAHSGETVIRRAGDGKSPSLQIARAIVVEEECGGFVMAVLDESHFENILRNAYDDKSDVVILDQFWEEVYSTEIAGEEELGQKLRSRRMAGEKIRQAADGISFYIMPIWDGGLFLVFGKEVVFTDDITSTLVGVSATVAALCMLLCMFMATLMSEYLTAPIKRLTKAMQNVQGGDLDVRVNSGREDELGQLSDAFDKMTGELKNYMELQVRQQKELSDSNIAMMQAQLNPHFLYNTLDTMKWLAKVNHVPEIATLSAGLARILRKSISAEKFITLSEEIRIVTYYAEIQQLRFNHSFSFDVEMPMELEDCIVPKLILQPIVENAILHGLRDKEEGEILCNIYEKQGALYIEVIDDGCGISEEMLELINKKDREALKGHIGFYNVNTILNLYYGEAYGVFVQAEREKGTKVTLTIPVNKEEQDAENIGGR